MKKRLRKIAPILMALLIGYSIVSSFAGAQEIARTTEEDLNVDIQPKRFEEAKMESIIELIVNARESKGAGVQSFATTALSDTSPTLFSFQSRDEIVTKDDKIRVVIELAENASLDGYDIAIEAEYKNLVQALVPVSAIKELAEDTAVQYIRLPYKPYPAAITSEGVGVINADKLHAKGITGEGVKVAVIDLGFMGYATNPELSSANITEVKSFRADNDTEAGEQHGTACTELIVDVAPNASLYLYNFGTEVEFGNAVDHAIAQGVDIISYSIAWVNAGGYDGEGTICDIVNDAHDTGILFVVSAGNAANQHHESTFNDTNGNNWTEFRTSPTIDEVLNLTILPAGTDITLYLSWDDWPASDQDYDLYLLVWNSTAGYWGIADWSENWQNGSQPPAEAIELYDLVGGYQWGVGIHKWNATRAVHFELYSFTNNFPEYNVKSSSLTIPADAAGAMTAGATYWDTDGLESFSSQGPTNDGRTKPDVTAPDGVSSQTYGVGRFYGTSASAPHTAGAAALLLSAKPSLTADQLQFYLESTAKDLGAPGKDNLTGSGRIDVLAAYNKLDFIADHVVISEVYANAEDKENSEWVELYNPTDLEIDISGWEIDTAAHQPDATLPSGATISSHGFYLIGDAGWTPDDSNWPIPDYSGEEITLTNTDGWIQLKNSTETVIDTVGWGSAGVNETSAYPDNPPENKSLQRKVNATITESASYGPAWDSDNNNADFFVRALPNPQNSTWIDEYGPLPPIPELPSLVLLPLGLMVVALYSCCRGRKRAKSRVTRFSKKRL